MIGDGAPPKWVVSLAAECDEAKRKQQVLALGIGSQAFAALPWRQRALMFRQAVIMAEYISVLSERLHEATGVPT